MVATSAVSQNWGKGWIVPCWLENYYMVVDHGAKWTSSHQCISWPFCALDGLRFFIRHKVGFIKILFSLLLTIVFFLFFYWFCGHFSLRPDLPPRYLAHFPTLLNTAPTLVLYLLSLSNIATLITSYPIAQLLY
jgi:hypothetical protein